MKNEALGLHPQVHGTYQLLAVTVNGHPSWTSSTHAIWYLEDSKHWVIGTFQDLGKKLFTFKGRNQHDEIFAMPCEENYWMYFNKRVTKWTEKWQKPNGYGLLYHANDINIQCTGKV